MTYDYHPYRVHRRYPKSGDKSVLIAVYAKKINYSVAVVKRAIKLQRLKGYKHANRWYVIDDGKRVLPSRS